MSSSPPPRCPIAAAHSCNQAGDASAVAVAGAAQPRRRRARRVETVSPHRPPIDRYHGIAAGDGGAPLTVGSDVDAALPAAPVHLVEQYILALLRDLLVPAPPPPASHPSSRAPLSKPAMAPAAALTMAAVTAASPHRGMRTMQLYQQANVAAVVCELLTQGVMATQRDVYYRLEKHYASQLDSNAALHHLAVGAGVPRRHLNVVASGRGAVGGCLAVDGVDLRAIGPQGMAIDGSMVFLSPRGGSSSSQPPAPPPVVLDVLEARFLLIVEKDAVFYRLMQERLFDTIPVILLSGFGFPSAAARALAWAICRAAQDRRVRAAATTEGGGSSSIRKLEVFGLVDYNPSGVQILLRYMEDPSLCTAEAAATGGRVCPHGGDGGVAGLRWLGLRSKHVFPHTATAAAAAAAAGPTLTTLPGKGGIRTTRIGDDTVATASSAVCGGATQIPSTPLTERDRRMLASLIKKCSRDRDAAYSAADGKSSMEEVPHRWRDELLAMAEGGRRADIEAAYVRAGGGAGPQTEHATAVGYAHRSPRSFADSIARSILQGDAV